MDAPQMLQEAWRRGPANVWRSEPVACDPDVRSRCSSACGDQPPGSPLALHDGDDAHSAGSSEIPFIVSTSIAPMPESSHFTETGSKRESDMLDPHNAMYTRDAYSTAVCQERPLVG